MPPRHAYWTILVDDQPTAFRAHDPEELLPTFNRLKEKNPSAVMKWFERGKLFDSRDAARDSGGGEGERRWEGPRPDRDDRGGDPAPTSRASGAREGPRREADRRDRTWRPGGEHKDPRQKYKDASKAKWDRFKKNIRDRSERGRAAAGETGSAPDLSPANDFSSESRDAFRASDSSSESMDPETFSPPHGDPLREHINEHISETPDVEQERGDTSEDRARPEPSRGDGAPSRPHGDPLQPPARPPEGDRDRSSGGLSEPRAGRDGGESRGGPPERQSSGGAVVRDRDRRSGGPSGPPQREGDWRDRSPRAKWDSRDSSPPKWESGESRGLPRASERSGESRGGGYQGRKPWDSGGADRNRREGGWRPQGPPSGDRSYRDREGGGGGADWRNRPRDDRGGSGGRSGYEGQKPREGGGGYQGRKPWDSGGGNRDSRNSGPSQGPQREGGWRPQGPPSGDRSYGDREGGGGGADWRNRPRDDRGGSGGRPGYEGKKPWGGPPRAKWDSRESSGPPRASDRSGESRGGGSGYQGRKPWDSGGGDRNRHEGGWRPQGPPTGDRPYGDRSPRAKWDSRDSRDDRGGSGGRPGYEGKKPWSGPPRAKWDSRESSGPPRASDRSSESRGVGPSDRAHKPWGSKPGGGKPWGAGPGSRPGGGKPWGSKPGGSRPPGGGKPFGQRGPKKRRDDE